MGICQSSHWELAKQWKKWESKQNRAILAMSFSDNGEGLEDKLTRIFKEKNMTFKVSEFYFCGDDCDRVGIDISYDKVHMHKIVIEVYCCSFKVNVFDEKINVHYETKEDAIKKGIKSKDQQYLLLHGYRFCMSQEEYADFWRDFIDIVLDAVNRLRRM